MLNLSKAFDTIDHRSIQHPHNVARRLSPCRGLTTVAPCSPVYQPVHLHYCSELWMLRPALWPVAHRAHMSAVLWSHYTGYQISHRIRFQLCTLMHGVHNGTSPSYLLDTTAPYSSLPVHRRLHSTIIITSEYDIYRIRTKFRGRPFSVAESRERNTLPADIRNITDLSSFKQAIKTIFLFVLAYSN